MCVKLAGVDLNVCECAEKRESTILEDMYHHTFVLQR